MHMQTQISIINSTHARQKANKLRYNGGIASQFQHANLSPKFIRLINYKLKTKYDHTLRTLWWTAAKGLTQSAVSPYA